MRKGHGIHARGKMLKLVKAGGLNNAGPPHGLAGNITNAISSYSPLTVLGLLFLAFFLIHYFFAGVTAHVTALFENLLVTRCCFWSDIHTGLNNCGNPLDEFLTLKNEFFLVISHLEFNMAPLHQIGMG